MCEPTTLAVASIASTVIGGATTAYGQIQAGKAEASMASYQSTVAKNNAIIAERMAQDALDRGKIAETNKRLETKYAIGKQRVALAANGVLVDNGSGLDLTTDTARFGELDALTIRSNAEREAFGYRTQGANYKAESDMALASGDAAKGASYMAAFGSVLGTAGSVAGKWYSFNKEGIFDSSNSTKVPRYPVSPSIKTGGAL
jgi:hypothetical protein